jgi:hypothetical protein
MYIEDCSLVGCDAVWLLCISRLEESTSPCGYKSEELLPINWSLRTRKLAAFMFTAVRCLFSQVTVTLYKDKEYVATWCTSVPCHEDVLRNRGTGPHQGCTHFPKI